MKIRIAVAVGTDGKWMAYNTYNIRNPEEICLACLPTRRGAAIYYITAEVPIPQSAEIEGRVQ